MLFHNPWCRILDSGDKVCLFILSFSGKCFSLLFHQFFSSPQAKIIQLIQQRFQPEENKYFLLQSTMFNWDQPLWLVSVALLSKCFHQMQAMFWRVQRQFLMGSVNRNTVSRDRELCPEDESTPPYTPTGIFKPKAHCSKCLSPRIMHSP